jgi:hypothetical protein
VAPVPTAAPTVNQAALNNASWCASVIRAHGGTAHFAPTLWWSVDPAPPLYPRAVTLAPALDKGGEQRLARLAAGDAVKDSFAALPLDGFDLLFEGTWFWRAPKGGAPAPVYVRTPEAFAAWVAAWGEGEGILPPALLQDRSVLILALGDSIEAGCILNLAGGVVGLSNVFGRDAAVRAQMIEAAAREAGEVALVGYEPVGADEDWLAAGFQPLGPLRVLLKQ